MLKQFYPYEYAESVFAIDYEKLWQMGYRGLLFDIDNTLVHHGDDSTPEIDALFREIQAIGFKTLLLSNNEEKRINRFMQNISSYYIHDAEKPKPWGYLKAAEIMELDKNQCVVIGDQVFTDVFGANRVGMASILVRFIRLPGLKKLGKRRRAEQAVLLTWRLRRRYTQRLGGIQKKTETVPKARRHFSDINPLFYKIATQKETLRRHLQDLTSHEAFATELRSERLPNIVSEHHSNVIKTGPGIDPVLQENKAVNIRLACEKLDGLVIRPGETFSFWRLVGNVTEKKGYKAGRVIEKNAIIPGLGGGLCNLANTINLLVLHSPLAVTEFHKHSDALACDVDHRKPLAAGTSIFYNYVDYRFKNTSDQNVQLCVWVANGQLYGELRSERAFPWTYALSEEDHHFRREGDKFYRISKIYKDTYDRNSCKLCSHELIWDNHSEVLFPTELIPPEMIRDDQMAVVKKF